MWRGARSRRDAELSPGWVRVKFYFPNHLPRICCLSTNSTSPGQAWESARQQLQSHQRRCLPHALSPPPAPPRASVPRHLPWLPVASSSSPDARLRPRTRSPPHLRIGTPCSQETCSRHLPVTQCSRLLPAFPPLLQPEEGLGAEPAPCGGRQPVCVSLAPTQSAPTRPHTVCTCVCTWQKHSGIEGTESSGSNCGPVTNGLCSLGQVT